MEPMKVYVPGGASRGTVVSGLVRVWPGARVMEMGQGDLFACFPLL